MDKAGYGGSLALMLGVGSKATDLPVCPFNCRNKSRSAFQLHVLIILIVTFIPSGLFFSFSFPLTLWDRILCSPGWDCGTPYVDENDLEFLALLFLPPDDWNHRHCASTTALWGTRNQTQGVKLGYISSPINFFSFPIVCQKKKIVQK